MVNAPHAGKGGRKPSLWELFMRRSAKDHQGLSSDVQPLATKRFRKAAGEKPAPEKRKRWF